MRLPRNPLTKWWRRRFPAYGRFRPVWRPQRRAATKSGAAFASLPRVAAIATMPGRLDTFEKVLPAIQAQVDHVFVYLDGYDAAPIFLQGLDRITVRHAQDLGDLHASSRFLCLQDLVAPTVVAIVDDDIVYPPDYVDRLVECLQCVDGRAIVGVHGRIFKAPHRSYVCDADALHFAQGLARPRQVHEVGTGTCAFISSRFDVNPTEWRRCNMDDLSVAAEAQRRGLPLVAMARAPQWLKPYAENQPDSLWAKALIDDIEQTRRMRELLGLSA